MKNEYSMGIAEAIKSFLATDDWRFSFNEENGIFHFGVGLGGKIKNITYAIKVKEDSYIVYAISPISADPEDGKMMAAMAEFVCRVSYGLVNGNFELDFRDGELRYKSFVDCDGGVIPTRQIIKNSIYCPAMMFKRCIPGILAIVFGGASAEEADRKCESEMRKMIAKTFLAEEADSFDDAEDDEPDIDPETLDAKFIELFGSRSKSSDGVSEETVTV